MTLADLTHAFGAYIPGGMLAGMWQTGSDLELPHQLSPPKIIFRNLSENFYS